MSDPEELRQQLVMLIDRTKSSETICPGAWRLGDAADKRRVLDDLRSGRLGLREAHLYAEHGLQALDQGDLETASWCLRLAIWQYIAVLEKKFRPGDKKKLVRPAKKRGRRKK